jgi:hypothetical protein
MSPVVTTQSSTPTAGHTYALPTVRELPRPEPKGSGGW